MNIGTLFVLATADAAVPVSWDLAAGAHHRWAVDTEVVLPGMMWLYSDRNRDVRARNVGIQWVFDCTASEPTRNVGVLDCTIEDASVTGATFPSERGRLQPVLEEMDAKLTGARVQLVMRPDGRVRTVKLEANELAGFRNRRTRYMEEALRTLMIRGLASFDVVMPRNGITDDEWVQFDSLLLTLPTQKGTAGSGRIVHKAQPHDATRVIVSSIGGGVLVDGGTMELGSPRYLDTQLTGYTVFDREAGHVSEALWTTYGEPTASAGVFAQAYAARTSLRALAPDESVELGPTYEWSPLWRGIMGFRDEVDASSQLDPDDRAP
ncbi:MAG: hypothetical protein R3F61_26375 [Myxococcota bacterium]